MGAGSALDDLAARVGRDLAPDREASIARAEPSPTVREAADPYYWVGGDGRPRAIPNSASGDRLVRPCDPNGQTMGPNGQTMGPNGQTMGPNGRTMGPNGQTRWPKWSHHVANIPDHYQRLLQRLRQRVT